MRALLVPARLGAVLLLFAAFGCQCAAPGPDGGSLDGGRIFARAAEEGGVEIVLADVTTPLRTLQVDVELSGGEAVEVVPAGPVSFNLIEAALDAPGSRLTLVVADTRRLPLVSGVIARLVTTADATATLSNALAVDDDGERRTLSTAAD